MFFQLACRKGGQSAAPCGTRFRAQRCPTSKIGEKEIEMSDPRYDRDPNRRATPYTDTESTAGSGSIWVAAIVAILVIAGIAAYSYRGTQTASNPPATTSGQSPRAPVTSPPASIPPASKEPAAPATPAEPSRRP